MFTNNFVHIIKFHFQDTHKSFNKFWESFKKGEQESNNFILHALLYIGLFNQIWEQVLTRAQWKAITAYLGIF